MCGFPEVVSAVGKCVSYDAAAFSEFHTFSEEWQHDYAHVGVSTEEPPSAVD